LATKHLAHFRSDFRVQVLVSVADSSARGHSPLR